MEVGGRHGHQLVALRNTNANEKLTLAIENVFHLSGLNGRFFYFE